MILRPSACWWLVGGGWACQVPAAAGVLLVSDAFGFLSLAGLACVVVGAVLLRRKTAVWIIAAGIFASLFMVGSLVFGAQDLAKSLWGDTANCQVTAVTQKITSDVRRNRRDRITSRKTKIYFAHDVRCPSGTYTVPGERPHPEGSYVEVRFDPRDADPPGLDRPNATPYVVLLSISGLVLLVLPTAAWRRGVRDPARDPERPPLPRTAPPQPAWPGAAPYEPWEKRHSD